MNKLPTVDIKGREYILVATRVKDFNERYPAGAIQTELVSPFDSKLVVIKAKVTPDASKPERFFTGYSQTVVGEGYINKTAALENCETSAVGRALAFMGIGIVDAIASADEVNKAKWSHKKEEKQFSDIEYVNEDDEARGNDARKRTIATIAASLAKRLDGKELKTAQDYSDWIGANCGLELAPENYSAILNELQKLAKK